MVVCDCRSPPLHTHYHYYYYYFPAARQLHLRPLCASVSACPHAAYCPQAPPPPLSSPNRREAPSHAVLSMFRVPCRPCRRHRGLMPVCRAHHHRPCPCPCPCQRLLMSPPFSPCLSRFRCVLSVIVWVAASDLCAHSTPVVVCTCRDSRGVVPSSQWRRACVDERSAVVGLPKESV